MGSAVSAGVTDGNRENSFTRSPPLRLAAVFSSATIPASSPGLFCSFVKRDFELSPWMESLVTRAVLAGATLGAGVAQPLNRNF
jgi:hypothetical protein